MKTFYFFLLILFFTGFSFSQTEDQKKMDFTKKVRDADMLFAQGKYLEAKKNYESAASIMPSDEGVKKQILLCDANEQKKSGFEADKEYNKLINKADEKFKNGDYQGSKDLFSRAVKIKTSDTYPPKMLRQIEDLLNPKPITKAEPLPDLGQSTEMSILDAQKALKAADIERKNKQNMDLLSKNESLAKNENELSSNRIKEMQAATTNFNDVRNRIDSLSFENKEVNDSMNIKLQMEQHSVISVTDFQQKYQHDLKVYVDQTITKRTNLSDSIGKGSVQIGASTDSILVQKYNKDGASADSIVKIMQDSRGVIEQKINSITHTEEKKNNDNRISKEEITELVNETTQNNSELEVGLADKNRKNSNEMVENNLSFSEKADVREKEKGKIIVDNEQLLKQQIQNREKSSDSLAKIPIDIRLQSHDSITLNYYKVDKIKNDKKDSNRYESNNQVKAVSTVVLTEIEQIASTQNEFRIKSDADIIKQKNIHNTIDETSKQKQDLTAKKITEIEESQNKGLIEAQSKETTDSYSSKDKINNLESKVLIGISSENTNTAENKTSLNTLENNIEGSTNLETEQRRIQTLEARTIIENIEKKEIKFDEKAANSIGSLYPEGVTQEQFNKNDDKGSLLAVVTRRIIVKNGYGQIYTRTQTNDFITYSKNGSPTTESIWQKETQDAKLKKN